MKKIRANAAIIASVFGITILFLSTFGTDAAYIILSRYKLQKITEEVAYEYAATKARDYAYKTDAASNAKYMEKENNEMIQLIGKYGTVYNTLGSGVMVFDIESLEYKSNRTNKETVVRAKTASKVMPMFLRHLGIKEIVIHSVACAKTNRLNMQNTIEPDTTSPSKWDYATSSDKVMTTFPRSGNSFTDVVDGEEISANYIIAKESQDGDFTVKFKYENASPTSKTNTNGGFFIIGGFNVKDDHGNMITKWVDIGDKAMTTQKPKRVCASGSNSEEYEPDDPHPDASEQCFYCVNSANSEYVTFRLNNTLEGGADTEGRINRVSKIRIYKAGGSGDIKTVGGIKSYQNPCNPKYAIVDDGKPKKDFYKYFNRRVKVDLTILNNVVLVRQGEYERFVADGADSQGIWTNQQPMPGGGAGADADAAGGSGAVVKKKSDPAIKCVPPPQQEG